MKKRGYVAYLTDAFSKKRSERVMDVNARKKVRTATDPTAFV